MQRLYQISMPQNVYRLMRLLALGAVFLLSTVLYGYNKFPAPVYAEDCGPCLGCGCGGCGASQVCTPTGCVESPTCDAAINDFGDLVSAVFDILFPVAIIIGFFLIARAGYLLMTSQGDPARVKEGKEEFSSAIMGLIFVALAMTILRLVIRLLVDSSI